ncbi:unnamed protein product [Adineta steineri]|uniref:Sulfotransferase domain-containing protein n=1 Tax=Adineta steineri TaxID=433720 RepID=A0A813YR39_9BILA|nr:unnamed protein product [Adineta steineri]
MIFIVTIISILTISSSLSEFISIKDSQNLPQAIIIGVKKCGTRALLKFLSTHSSIAASSTEIHFFDSFNNFQHGLQWYRKQMPITKHNQYITIEKTPYYFIDKYTPLRIAKALPEVKLIIILRNPIIRAISDYVQIRNRHETYPTFDELISYTNFTQWTPVKIGCYTKYLYRWLKYFPLKQIHFVNGENLIQRPWEELEYVQKFLNISINIQEKDFYFNSNKHGFPCIRQINGCLGSNKGRQHPTILEKTREKLKDFYSKCNAQLKQLAQIDFSWIE